MNELTPSELKKLDTLKKSLQFASNLNVFSHIFAVMYLWVQTQPELMIQYTSIMTTFVATVIFHSGMFFKHSSRNRFMSWSIALFTMKLLLFAILLYDYSMHFMMYDPFIIVGISLILHVMFDIVVGTALISGLFHDLQPYLPFTHIIQNEYTEAISI